MTEQPPPPAPGYGSVPGAATGARPGELLDRFLARLIDGLIVGVVYVVVAVVIIIGVVLSSVDSSYVTSVITAVILVGLQLGYFVFMETSRGQTVGKMVMKLRVVGPQGGLPTMEQSLRRNIWMALGLAAIVPIVGGLVGGVAQLVAVIMIAVGINGDPVNRQAWHDKFGGGTRVLKIG